LLRRWKSIGQNQKSWMFLAERGENVVGAGARADQKERDDRCAHHCRLPICNCQLEEINRQLAIGNRQFLQVSNLQLLIDPHKSSLRCHRIGETSWSAQPCWRRCWRWGG